MISRHLHPCGTLARFAAVAAASLLGLSHPAPASQPDPANAPALRRDRLPRKVLIGTVISGTDIFSMPLAKRLDRMDALVAKMADEASRAYPAKRLDLAVLPEAFLARPGETVAEQSVRLDDVRQRIGACARLHGCYLVVPVLMLEGRFSDPPQQHRGAGRPRGKRGRHLPEGASGRAHGKRCLGGRHHPRERFPRLRLRLRALGDPDLFRHALPRWLERPSKEGAELVALPSASPETVRPASYAREHAYYIVSASPRYHAAFFSPLGMIEAQISKESVLVHEIDLSYALLHWEAILENGEALRRRYGDRVGFNYYEQEDMGIFWSNDPKMTIGQMIASAGLIEVDESVARIGILQDKARGGPPVTPR